MPWGSKRREPAYCIGCGKVGTDFVERRPMLIGGLAYLRVCPACYRDGWRLEGAHEEGQFVLAEK